MSASHSSVTGAPSDRPAPVTATLFGTTSGPVLSGTGAGHDPGDDTVVAIPPVAGVIRPCPPRLTGERASEAECQRTILEAAQFLGYRVMAIRPAINARGHHQTPFQGDPGWPDMTMAHPVAGLIHVELKRWPNRLEPRQARWARALLDAGAHWQIVWVPEELQTFIDDLTRWAGR